MNTPRRTVAWTLPIPIVAWSFLGSSGCATIVRGKHQEIELDIRPKGTVAVYEGREVKSGDRIMIIKRADSPSIYFDGPPYVFEHNLEYEIDPWMIADGALLLVGILSGVIGLVVDIGNGNWRDLISPQTIFVPHPQTPSE